MHIKLNAVNLDCSNSLTTNFCLIFVQDSRNGGFHPPA